MKNDYAKIREFLHERQGSPFDILGIPDESNGRWVRDDQILNKFLVRFLKINIAPSYSTGEIGKYLYTHCSDLLTSHSFWRTQKGQVCFMYSWN